MSYILAFDTSTKACSVALFRAAELLAFSHTVTEGFVHAEQLHVRIGALMKQASLSFDQLDAVAVGKGPGSYTGLRIGVSAAKGLAYALDIPLIAVESLDFMLFSASLGSESFVMPMIDARRLEAFAKLVYVSDQSWDVKLPTTNLIFDTEEFEHILDGVGQEITYFIGDAAKKAEEFLSNHPKVSQFRFDDTVYPNVSSAGALLNELYHQKRFEDVVHFEPFYLKDFMITPFSKGVR
jgi:tRNA threonylcarbamoyladenosine biosynthesis protein TsaB